MSEPRVVHSHDLPWETHEQEPLFAFRRQRLAKAAGGRALGCSLIELQPSKTAWPFHYHLGNEEALYVLQGRGMLRLGERRVSVEAGDYVAFPPVDAAAHQLTNTGDAPLRYLVLSTMNEPDVVVYPDSNKVGVMAGAAPGGDRKKRTLQGYFPRDAEVDYWHGEGGSDESGGSTAATEAVPAQESDEDHNELVDRVEAELVKLEKRFGLSRLAAASSSVRSRVEQKVDQLKNAVRRGKAEAADPEEAAALEQQIDDEIAALKKKLKL